MAPRVLLARPDHLGDVLLTLPAVAAFRGAVPDAQITYVVHSALREVPEAMEGVDEVIDLPFPPPDASASLASWQRVARETASRLNGRFDMAVLLRPNDPWTGGLAMAARIPIRVGYPQPGTRRFLTHSVAEPPVHCVDLALTLLGAAANLLGRRIGPPRPPPLSPASGAEAAIDGVLSAHGDGGARPIVVHPGSGWPIKDWPEERWAHLTGELAARYEAPVLVAGTAQEEPLIRRIARAGAGSPVIGLRFGELVTLHRRAALVVSTDNGAMHLAALLGVPVVGIYGPGDPLLSGPWGAPARSRVVRTGIECSPCREFADPPCGASTRPACVMGIDVGMVLAAVENMLRQPAGTDAGR